MIRPTGRRTARPGCRSRAGDLEPSVTTITAEGSATVASIVSRWPTPSAPATRSVAASSPNSGSVASTRPARRHRCARRVGEHRCVRRHVAGITVQRVGADPPRARALAVPGDASRDCPSACPACSNSGHLPGSDCNTSRGRDSCRRASHGLRPLVPPVGGPLPDVPGDVDKPEPIRLIRPDR